MTLKESHDLEQTDKDNEHYDPEKLELLGILEYVGHMGVTMEFEGKVYTMPQLMEAIQGTSEESRKLTRMLLEAVSENNVGVDLSVEN